LSDSFKAHLAHLPSPVIVISFAANAVETDASNNIANALATRVVVILFIMIFGCSA
jgi:hypothetical protein